MRAILNIALFLVASANGAAIEIRQVQSSGISDLLSSFGSSLQNMIAPASKPFKIENVQPRLRVDAKRQYIFYGPLTLPASKDGGTSIGEHGNGSPSGPASGSAAGSSLLSGGIAMDPNGFPFSRTMDGGFCSDCTVLGAKIDIVFGNGTRADIANGVYLHHLTAMTTGKSQPSWIQMCPGNGSSATGSFGGLLSKLNPDSLPSGASFVGGAVDEFIDYFTTPDGRFNSGYYIPQGAKAFMSGEVINYLNEQQQVYIRLDLEWVPGKVGTDAIKTPLNVEGCDFTHAAFKKAEGKGKLTSEDYTVTKDGTIICQRAHMHDGGVAVTAFVNGRQICSSQATYGLAGGSTVVDGKEWKTISKMSECTEPIKLAKGDKIRLTADYDNVGHPLRKSHGMEQGNMGFMIFTFVPGS